MQRNTKQREAIRAVLEQADRPLSAEEVLEQARKLLPGLGIATVYRTLKSFTADGLITPVELPNDGARYEISARAHHHFFRCRACDRIYEFPGCVLTTDSSLPPGFVEENHILVFNGVCAACVKSGAQAAELAPG